METTDCRACLCVTLRLIIVGLLVIVYWAYFGRLTIWAIHSTTWPSLSHNWAGRGSRRVERPTTVRAYVNRRYLEIPNMICLPISQGLKQSKANETYPLIISFICFYFGEKVWKVARFVFDERKTSAKIIKYIMLFVSPEKWEAQRSGVVAYKYKWCHATSSGDYS